MAVLYQVGAARIFHFDNELCSFYRLNKKTGSETLSHTSISACEGVDLIINAFSIDRYLFWDFFKETFFVFIVWFLHSLSDDDYIFSHPVCWSVNAVFVLSCEFLNKSLAVSFCACWLMTVAFTELKYSY